MEAINKGAHGNVSSSFALTDNAMLDQVRDTHSIEPYFIDVKPILSIVEDILNRCAPTIHRVIHGTAEYTDHTVDEKIGPVGSDNIFEELSHIIHKLSCELYCKCSGGDVHASTVLLCKMIASYSWEAKVVLVLAAFSVNYGDFWLVAQKCTENPLAKSIAILNQVVDTIEHSKEMEPHFDAIDKLIKAIIDVTKRIVEFSELPLEYLSLDTPSVSAAKAHIPAASYWTIRSIVACASHFATITGMRHEYTGTSELWEISNMTHKLNSIRDHLTNELAHSRQQIEEMRYDEEYRNLIRLLESIHLDNMKKPVSIEVLRRKDVLLLISNLDLPLEEIEVLENVYGMRQDILYEMVWIPIVDRLTDWKEQQQYKFTELQSKMPWYTVTSPLVIKPPVIRYIKEFWNFDKKAILVALDKQGKVSSKNALHMVWIWGNLAFPFTDEKEESMWRAESWRLELLVNGIDQDILNWIKVNKFICLYGGEDIDWIRDFTTRVKAVAKALDISIELVYVGKKNAPKKRLERITSIIEREKLSLYWPDHTSTWFFWSRLESMRFSKTRHGMTVENDQIMKEVQTILSYDGSEQGWVILWKGSTEKARANGQLALSTLKDFNAWQQAAIDLGLVPALDNELKKRHTAQHCISLILPGIGLDLPQKMTCAECGREMERYFMFRCCDD
ncbi:hypothetical protein FNV43_RR21421 [Rhamnella rubrinervis]|uniref:Protein SIEVE ELEMENT OCCLUSION B-like n=1 Tax=Rhamnella rubrinervis TaxID=2594499 RepID=A0A8K0GRF2_9ROSA|nr:hypothetical protein FNV43_RR21421 [Rhamnella rubrinervis]